MIDFDAFRFCFIFGCGHTGTTLLTVVLGHHSKIYSIPDETACFRPRLGGDAKAVLEQFLVAGKIGSEHRPEIVVEKTPRHVHHIDKIVETFPNAKLLGMVRDPRDIVASLKERTKVFDASLHRVVRSHQDLLKGRAQYPIRIQRYEDLVTNFESQLRDICGWLGLSFEPLMLQYHEKENRHQTTRNFGNSSHLANRNWQINQPIMNRRGRYKNLLSPEEIELVEKECAFIFEEFGYEREAA